MKKKAAERAAAAKAKTGGDDDADADAKRARLEELKRKAAERAKQRREAGE